MIINTFSKNKILNYNIKFSYFHFASLSGGKKYYFISLLKSVSKKNKNKIIVK